MSESRDNNHRIVIFLSLICVVSNLSYYPVLVANGLGRTIAIGAWLIFGIYVFVKPSRASSISTYRVYKLLYGLFLLNTVFVSVVNGVNAFSNHFFLPVTISFIVFTLSNRIGREVGLDGMYRISTVYYYTMAAVSIPLFFLYLRGTDLVTALYGYQYGKNEIAVLLLCALIIACILYNPKNRIMAIIRIIAVVFFVLDILMLRSRSVFFGIVLLAIVIIVNSKHIHRSLRAVIILGILIIIVYFFRNSGSFDSFLRNIVYAGRNAHSVNDISSGRISQITFAFSTFCDHPFFGVGKRFTCDCMYASVLANYGILSWPLWIMAIKPLSWGIKNLNRYDPFRLCFFVIAISLFVLSLLEERAPFGPGVRCYILWLFWGILINSQKDNQEALYEKNH